MDPVEVKACHGSDELIHQATAHFWSVTITHLDQASFVKSGEVQSKRSEGKNKQNWRKRGRFQKPNFKNDGPHQYGIDDAGHPNV